VYPAWVTAQEYREDILKMMQSHAADSYKETVRVSALIEDKAQKTAALAGVFLAAGLGFIKPENLKPDSSFGSFWVLFPLTLAVVCLIITVVLCLRALWIREQAAPIQMVLMKKMVLRIGALPDPALTDELQDRSRIQVTNWWVDILDRQERTSRKKAWHVRCAQGWLTVSIFLVAISLLIVLIGSVVSRMLAAFEG